MSSPSPAEIKVLAVMLANPRHADGITAGNLARRAWPQPTGGAVSMKQLGQAQSMGAVLNRMERKKFVLSMFVEYSKFWYVTESGRRAASVA